MDHLIRWYEVRDTLLGQNLKQQDIRKALELAAACEHDDARWLAAFCERNHVTTEWEADQAFSKETNDARALCFAAAMSGDENRMRQSAAMGYAYAQAWMANRTRGEEKIAFAQQAAKQGERDGFLRLGTKEGYLRAIELGCVEAMCSYAQLFPESDPQRFFWMGQATSHGAASFQFCKRPDRKRPRNHP